MGKTRELGGWGAISVPFHTFLELRSGLKWGGVGVIEWYFVGRFVCGRSFEVGDILRNAILGGKSGGRSDFWGLGGMVYRLGYFKAIVGAFLRG